jgi:hypothetical protein
VEGEFQERPANDMSPSPLPHNGEILLYQTEHGRTRVECRFEHETIWFSQSLMAELFQTTPQNITLYIKPLYDDGDVDEAATCKDYLQVRLEGDREVRRAVKYYNLVNQYPAGSESPLGFHPNLSW